MTLGKHIIELRNARGLSQADLAEAMDVSRQSVSKWETGASTPDLEKLVKLSDYFGLSLDELVKGEISKNSSINTSKETAREPSSPQNKRTKAQSIGIFFFCLSAFSAILFTIIFGIWGILFASPFLLFGMICYFVNNHPLLKAVWADYMLISLFLHYAVRINPRNILYTFKWTYQMNYAVLVLSWIWFLAVSVLITGTAFILRNKDFSLKAFAPGAFLFLLSYLTGAFGTISFWTYVLPYYLQLAGLTLLATSFARWMNGRKKDTRF